MLSLPFSRTHQSILLVGIAFHLFHIATVYVIEVEDRANSFACFTPLSSCSILISFTIDWGSICVLGATHFFLRNCLLESLSCFIPWSFIQKNLYLKFFFLRIENVDCSNVPSAAIDRLGDDDSPGAGSQPYEFRCTEKSGWTLYSTLYG